MNDEKDLIVKETFNLAIKNHQENKIDIAQELYNQVLKINPGHTQALNNLAVIFTNLKEYQKAKSCYEKAIEYNSNYTNAHFNLGNLFKKLGENQKAKSCYEKAIEIDPLNKKNQVAYGRILLILNDKLKGYEYIKKGQGVIKFTPSYYKII